MYDPDIMKITFDVNDGLLKKALKFTCFSLAAFFIFVILLYYTMNAVVQETEMREIQIKKLKGEN